MKILIIRHALAEDRMEWAKINSSDDGRPLTKEGIKQFQKVVPWVKKYILKSDLLLTSPLKRAQQTSKIVEDTFSVKFEITEDLRPNKNPELFIKKYFKPHVNFLVLVGHEPFLSKLIGKLIETPSERIKIKKSGFCIIDYDLETQSGNLEVLVKPKFLLGRVLIS